LILVTGATGTQGGATAHALLARGLRVRIFTRNPDSKGAKALIQAGAQLAIGDMGDPNSIDAAMSGVYGVFSVPLLDTTDNDLERKHSFALIQSALKAGVRHFVHTSVASTHLHKSFPLWGTGYWWEKYWTDKWDIEEAVRNAGFEAWTVLKPTVFMANFAATKAAFLLPSLKHGKIASVWKANTPLHLISDDDIGEFACAAFQNPTKFNHKNIDLAGEILTTAQIAATLSKVLNKKVEVIELTTEEAVAQGLPLMLVRSSEWTNQVGYYADIDALKSYGIPLHSFEQWIQKHLAEIDID
jgi:uncharacterized protein YbjT (DUF2867 family)